MPYTELGQALENIRRATDAWRVSAHDIAAARQLINTAFMSQEKVLESFPTELAIQKLGLRTAKTSMINIVMSQWETTTFSKLVDGLRSDVDGLLVDLKQLDASKQQGQAQ